MIFACSFVQRTFANVDQEFWLFYMQGPVKPGYRHKDQQGNNQIAPAVS